MIDDWLSSQAIAAMDALEELGYFRLCLHAAKKEQGVPDDDVLLANLSRLEGQWNKATRDKRFRSNLTSGEKIRACFYAKDGRLFNSKVDKNIADFQKRQEQRSRGGVARWENERNRARDELKHEDSMCLDRATRVGSENKNLKEEKKDSEVLSPETDETWQLILKPAREIPLVMSEDAADLRYLWRLFWCPLSFEQRKDAIEKLEWRKTRQYADPAKAPTFENFLRYKRKEINRPESNGKGLFVNEKPPRKENPIIPPDNRPPSEKFSR